MEKQLIITIARECGSGGHTIGQALAERFGVAFYDHNLLDIVAQRMHMTYEEAEKYDEVPRNMFFYRKVNGFSNSPEEIIAHKQFGYLQELAKAGESFVVVGRCAEEMLKEYNAISIFVLADMKDKIRHIAARNNVSEDVAEKIITVTDKKRKAYHNFYCKGKWGDSRNYDLTVNSSRLNLDRTADMIEHYVKMRIEE